MPSAPNVPPNWMIYLQVEKDCLMRAQKRQKLCSAVRSTWVPQQSRTHACMSVISDPAGAQRSRYSILFGTIDSL